MSTTGHAGDTAAPPGGTAPATAAPHEPLELPRTRTSAAWVAAVAGLLLTLLMLVFILQNGTRVEMRFLWMHFGLPLGVGLLLAGVIGALIVVSLGVGRMVQLRLAARRHTRSADRAAVSGRATTR